MHFATARVAWLAAFILPGFSGGSSSAVRCTARACAPAAQTVHSQSPTNSTAPWRRARSGANIAPCPGYRRCLRAPDAACVSNGSSSGSLAVGHARSRTWRHAGQHSGRLSEICPALRRSAPYSRSTTRATLGTDTHLRGTRGAPYRLSATRLAVRLAALSGVLPHVRIARAGGALLSHRDTPAQ